MSTVQARSAFDLQERTRIQRALRRYMEQHGIGTPTLQLRIMEADTPRHRELPLSTLQRFITGSHRTSDAYVGMCQKFLESVGPQEGEAPEFGAALFAFLREPLVPEERDALTENLEERFAGEYESRSKPATQGGEFPYPPETELLESRASFIPAAGEPYLHVREFVPDPAHADRTPQRRHAYDGVLVSAAPLVHVFMRSSLTRQPKIYTLAEAPVTAAQENVLVLEGEGFETAFLRDNPTRQRLVRNYRVQLVPRREEEGAP